jgi:4-amino-4-deoxy-L-arabinose transferase-like glycosyltransferase
MTNTPTLVAILLLMVASVAFKANGVFTEVRPLTGDEPVYVDLASGMTRGEGFQKEGKPTAWRTPGFPAYLAVMLSLTQENNEHLFATRIIIFLINTLILPLTAWLAWLLFQDKSVAMLAGVLWSLLGNSHALASEFMGEEPAILLLALGLIACIYALKRDSALLALGAGLLVGVAVLVRGYLLFVTIVVPVFYLTDSRDARRMRFAGLTALGGFAVLMGWMARNEIEMGSFTLSTEGPEQIWIGNNIWTRGSWDGWNSAKIADQSWPQTRYLQERHPGIESLTETQLAAVFAEEAVKDLGASLGRILWLLPRKAIIFWYPSSYLGTDWTYAACLPFFAVGALFLVMNTNKRGACVILLGPVVAVLALCALTFGDPRFRHPVDPLIVICSSYGMVRVWRAAMVKGPVLKDRQQCAA